ncbi:MAG: class I SAM-dependent methyltransferase [Cyanophyceae cyanobacterium]
MATILRTWSYQYQWLYNGISRLAALSVGGENRFRHLALQGLPLDRDTAVLDLCCGAGQTTQILVQYSQNVTGLDVSPVALKRAAAKVPQAQYVEGRAQELPFDRQTFDLVHASVALHEMDVDELQQLFQEVYRVLKPGGTFTFLDFHHASHWFFRAGLAIFLGLFETETAWQFIEMDLQQRLEAAGFKSFQRRLFAGNSLQVIQAKS